ncbi:MAG TPA: DUF5668 domain-containing protein [Herpetosiphonaceae bacterium]
MSVMQEQARPARHGGLVGPALLVAVGVVFLLNNMGILAWSVWDMLWRFWPVVLIAIGLDLLVGRRIGQALSALFILVLLAVLVGATLIYGTWSVGQAIPAGTTFSQPIGEARQANINVEFGVGTLRVNALPESANLIEGAFTLPSNERVISDVSDRSGTAYVTLRSQSTQTRGFWRSWQGDRVWDIKLSPDLPLQLRINSGVGTALLNLSQLQVTDLTINTGVGQTTVTLPESGTVRARIEGGVGDAVVVVPNGMAAKIDVQTGLGHVTVPDSYSQQDKTYTSPDYATATSRVDLRIQGGLGNITVQQAAER